MAYRNEIKEIKLIIDEIIDIYKKNIDILELDDLLENIKERREKK